MQHLAEQFYAFCDKRYSESAACSYKSAVRRFLVFQSVDLHREPDLHDFTEQSFQLYDASRKRGGSRQSTRLQDLYYLRAFAGWLISQGHMDDNPLVGITIHVTEKPRQPCATVAEVKALLHACDRTPDPRTGQCAKAILAIIGFCALRQNEAILLDVADVDLSTGILRVRHGKGGKQRTVHINSEARQILSAWLVTRQEWQRGWPDKMLTTRLLVTERLRPVTEFSCARLLADTRAVAGLRDAAHLTAHAFRRFMASAMLRVPGVNMRDVKEHLGHESILTTARYVQTTTDQTKQAVEAVHVNEEPAAAKDNREKKSGSGPAKRSAWRRGA